MNLVFSYSVHEDRRLAEAGFTFLGASYDKHKGEVHVFQLMTLEQARQEDSGQALDLLTEKAAPLVKHSIQYDPTPFRPYGLNALNCEQETICAA